MFENIVKFFKKFVKEKDADSKDTAKERLHLVLMQDRANVSADFLELMKQEIIDVIKKYIDVDENSIDVKLTNKQNGDGTTGAPILYANIPIVSIKDENKNKIINENKEKNKEDNTEVSEEIEDAAKENKEETVVEEEIKEKEDEVKEVEKEEVVKNEEATSEQKENNDDTSDNTSNEKQEINEEIKEDKEDKEENDEEVKK